jgi:hypothetical protein
MWELHWQSHYQAALLVRVSPNKCRPRLYVLAEALYLVRVASHVQAAIAVQRNSLYSHMQASIAEYKKGTLSLQAGCNLEQTLEATVTGELNGIREIAGKVRRARRRGYEDMRRRWGVRGGGGGGRTTQAVQCLWFKGCNSLGGVH